jgi:vanillin dehydrogenase
MSAAFELIDGIPNYNLYVGGKWVRSSRNEAVESRNPATGELFAKVQQAGAAETELAISAAHGAYKAWAATPISAREAIFFRAADVLAAKTKEIVEVLIQESGSIAGKAGFEVGYCFDLLRTAAAEMRRSAGETMPLTAPGQFGFTVRQPLGVIAGIAPFNAPFLLAMKKVVLALAAGNGFILKPSELTPVTGLKIAEVFDEAGLPPGLLSVVPGLASEVGAAIFADPGADDHVHRLNPDRSPSRRRSGEDAQTSAGIIPYPDVGTINPAVYIFTAANTGPIAAFFCRIKRQPRREYRALGQWRTDGTGRA